MSTSPAPLRSWFLAATGEAVRTGLQAGCDVLVLESAALADPPLLQGHSLGQTSLVVRINGLAADDLAAAMALRPWAILLPQVASHADIQHLAVKLRVLEAEQGLADGVTRIIIAIDTPAGVLGMHRLRPHPRLAGMVWDAARLAAALGLEGQENSPLLEQSKTVAVLAAHAAGIMAIDASPLPANEAAEAHLGQSILRGFTAAMTGNASLIGPINALFPGRLRHLK